MRQGESVHHSNTEVVNGGVSPAPPLTNTMYLKTKEDKDTLNAFGIVVLGWAEKLHKMQSSCIHVYKELVQEYSSKDSGKPFFVNGCAYYLAIAELAENLRKLAIHHSRECNRLSGYQLDVGELEDVFKQQTEWNEKHCDGFSAGKIGKGES